MPQVLFGNIMIAAIVPAMAVACWSDVRHHRVPNWLNAVIALTGLTAQAGFCGWPGLAAGLQGMGVGFGLLVMLWAIKGMGAGDVKFMAAMGAWLGPKLTFYAVLAGGLVGGVLAIGMILYLRTWRQAYANLGLIMAKVSSAKTAFSEFGSARTLSQASAVMPYAVPLSIGTVIVLVSNYSGWWEVL
jgi:prepilin peptidase CpaA